MTKDESSRLSKEALLRLGRQRLAKRRKAREYLRRMRQSWEKQAESASDKGEAADVNILLLIDDEQKQDLLRRLLNEHGFRTLLAEDLRSALTQTSREIPDMLILEVMGGAPASLQVLQKLRELDKLRELPVLVILPPQDAEYEKQLGQAPAVRALLRPFARSQIAAAMQDLLDPGEPDTG